MSFVGCASYWKKSICGLHTSNTTPRIDSEGPRITRYMSMYNNMYMYMYMLCMSMSMYLFRLASQHTRAVPSRRRPATRHVPRPTVSGRARFSRAAVRDVRFACRHAPPPPPPPPPKSPLTNVPSRHTSASYEARASPRG